MSIIKHKEQQLITSIQNSIQVEKIIFKTKALAMSKTSYDVISNLVYIKIKRELEIILTNLDDIKNNLNIRKLILINEEIKTKTLIKTDTKLTNTILSIIQKTSIKIK